MKRIQGKDFDAIRKHFVDAAKVAANATCRRARCGSVIVKDGTIIGSGFNAPPLGDESQRFCDVRLNTESKPKYDATCCVHAEWNAVIDACTTNASKITGSTLYFMRINDAGEFTDAGHPYCTTCSRFTMQAGVESFALYNDDGADVYRLDEYNRLSYSIYLPSLAK